MLNRRKRSIGKRFVFCIFLISASFNYFAVAGADTIYLKNGRSIQGFIKGEDNNIIEFDVGIGTIKFRREEIERIYKSTPEESSNIHKKWQAEKSESERRLDEQKRIDESKPKQVEFNQEQGHIIVYAVLNKNVKVELLLDTGASVVVLRNEIGRKIGLDMNNKRGEVQLQLADGRQVKAVYVKLENISVQGSEAQNVDAAILPDDVNDANFKDGLLGMSFLNNFSFKVDRKNNKLILEKYQ